MVKAPHFKSLSAIAAAVSLAIACAYCHSAKAPSTRPAGAVQESAYGIPVHLYQVKAVINARPERVEEYFTDLDVIKDRLGEGESAWARIGRRFSGKGRMDFGDSADLTVGLLGQSLPCRMSVIKHVPGKETWLLIISRDSWAWLLFRIGIKPRGNKSEISVNAIGNAREDLTPVNAQLSHEVVQRIDQWVGMVQKELDPEDKTSRPLNDGMMGELDKELFQANQASVWIDAPPDKVADWIAANAGRFMPELEFGGDCKGLTSFLDLEAGEMECCPVTYRVAGITGDMNTTLTWRKKGEGKTLRVYLQAREAFGLIRFEVEPESGGTRLKSMITIELPDVGTPLLHEKMMAISSVPGRLKKLVTTVKAGAETAN